MRKGLIAARRQAVGHHHVRQRHVTRVLHADREGRRPPFTTCWLLSGVFWMSIAGLITSTLAVSLSVTFGPTGGVPVTVAVFVKSRRHVASEQV